MDSATRGHEHLSAAALDFLAATGILITLRALPRGFQQAFSWNCGIGDIFLWLVAISPLIFAFGAVLALKKSRRSYALGLMAGLAAFPWYLWTELTFYDNSWIALNGVGTGSESPAVIPFFVWKLISTPLILAASATSVLRLLPARWLLNGRPLRMRVWPAFAVCLVVQLAWYVNSVSPYRIPLIVDGITPDIRILRVEKHGLRLRETLIAMYRNGGTFASIDDRNLFQYQWDSKHWRVVLPTENIHAIMSSRALSNSWTKPAKMLTSWNAERWYVTIHDSHALAFTSEYQTLPPQEIKNLFEGALALPRRNELTSQLRDACLGYCYDPVAALGFCFRNDPAFVRMRANHRTR